MQYGMMGRIVHEMPEPRIPLQVVSMEPMITVPEGQPGAGGMAV